jgi:hypothetical protein
MGEIMVNWIGSERRLRVATAIALLGLAGCADNAASSQAAPQSPIEVKIAPQGNVQPAQASRLSAMIAEEAQRRKMPRRDGEKLDGVLDAARTPEGLYLVTVIDVNNGKGKRLHRIVDDGVKPRQTLNDADLLRIAARAVEKLLSWSAASGETTGGIMGPTGHGAYEVASLGPDDTVAAARIGAILEARPVFDIVMGPAPGDGADALKAALVSELAKLPAIGDAGRYRIRGDVDISSRDDGDVGVAIRWRLAAWDGRPLGVVTQTRNAAPARIATYWGDLAKAAAGPAAGGILEMLKPAPMLPGNAS